MPKGRPAKATERHKADGTYQPVRHAKRLDAKPADGIPEAPPDFDSRHREKWFELCGHLKDLGVLANQDLDSIRAYCIFWWRFQDANKDLDMYGTVIETEKGRRVNPSWRVVIETQKEISRLWSVFGLTPADRARIKIEKPKPEASILDFLNGGRKKAQ